MEQLLNSKEVAEILRVDRNTVYIWTRSGKLKYASKIGRAYLYRASDFMKEGEDEDNRS